jgi:hypothetical protein
LTRTKLLSVTTAALLGSGLLAACGGGGGDEDPQQVLDQTTLSDVHSANIDLSVSGSAEGDQGGNFDVSLSGPVQGENGKFPQFDLTGKVTASGAGQDFDFEGGLISTGDQGFVSYNGTDYEVPSTAFGQIVKASEKAQKQQKDTSGLSPSEAFAQGCTQSLVQQGADESAASDACDIDFKALLTNLSNEGDADVEGADTIHISGDANVDQIASDFAALVKATPQGQQLPQSAIDQVVQQATDAVDEATIDVYSGKDDHLLRKLDFSLKVTPPDSASSSGIDSISADFSLSLSGVNEEQTIEAPSNAKSLSDLTNQIGIPGLSGLGGLGGAGSSGGSVPLPGGGGGGGGVPSLPGGTGGAGNAPNPAQTQAFLKCLQQAQGDQAALQACANKVK